MVSWGAFVSAVVLGWVLWWALGRSYKLNVALWERPAHALWRECSRQTQVFFLVVGIGLLVLAGATLIARAIRAGGWRQIGLWAGILLIVDALLIVQYLRYVMPLCPTGFD